MRQTTGGKSWIGGMLFALLLCVGGFANAASLLLEMDCYSLEMPGSRRVSSGGRRPRRIP